MIRKIMFIIVSSLCFATSASYSQNTNTLNIDSCYALALRNYPLVQQFDLIEKAKGFSIENANKGYFPRFNVAGQATYQSDVTQLPISLPNVDIQPLSKDQYKLYGEVIQPLTDLLTINKQKELVEANSEIEEQKIEIELYKLKERINQLYFGIYLIDAQILQIEWIKKDIQIGIDKTNAAIDNGIALKSNVDLLKAELLNINQRTIELKANRQGFIEMLSLFINQPIQENTTFETPLPKIASDNINRLELKLFDIQHKTFDIQNKLIVDKNLPKFNLFFQGGLGRPALNMLSNEANGYFIGGLRLSWNISNFYTFRNEKQLINTNKKSIEIQRETFLFNTNLSIKQQNAEITKLQELINNDVAIIKLREGIKTNAKNQLEYGVVTTNDYINYLNAEEQAKQNMILHQIQLLLAQYNYQSLTGN